MIDIHNELNKYTKEFISLGDFLNDVFKVVDDDIPSVILWILMRIKKVVGVTLYTINEFNELECYSDNLDVRYDFGILYDKLDTVRQRDCLPGVKDADGYLTPGYWEDPDFERIGFKKTEIFEIFPEILEALNKQECADFSEQFELQDNNACQKELCNDDNLVFRIERLEKENKELRVRVRELEQERPILLRAYRDDDPLYLAIEIRNREWANYDPENDRATRGNQGAITTELKKRGFTSRQAESIEVVACPIKR